MACSQLLGAQSPVAVRAGASTWPTTAVSCPTAHLSAVSWRFDLPGAANTQQLWRQNFCSRGTSPVELSSSPAAWSRHHLQTVPMTAEGTPFLGSMNTALWLLICSTIEEHSLIYLLTKTTDFSMTFRDASIFMPRMSIVKLSKVKSRLLKYLQWPARSHEYPVSVILPYWRMASATPDLQLWLPSRHRKTVTYLLTYLQSEWWGAGMVICLERGADLHMAQLMPLPLTVSCSSKIQIGFPFWYQLTRVVPEKGPLNVCVCVCVFYLSGTGLPRLSWKRGH